jgi:methyl-accepting chemotaxis protein
LPVTLNSFAGMTIHGEGIDRRAWSKPEMKSLKQLQLTSLKSRMLVLVLPVVALGIGALAVLSITRATDNQKRASYSDLSNRTKAIAAQWGGAVDVKLQLARTLAAELPAALAHGRAATLGVLTGFVSSDSTGQFAGAEIPQPSPKTPILAAVSGPHGVTPFPLPYAQVAPAAQAMIADPAVTVNEPLIYQGDAKGTFSAPIVSHGRTLGAAAIGGSLQTMFGQIAKQTLYNSGYIVAVSAKGTLLLSPQKTLNGQASLASLASSKHMPALGKVAGSGSGQLEAVDPLHGRESVVTWAPIGTSGWKVVTFTPTGEVLASANSLRTTLIIVSLVVLVVLGLVIVLVAGRLTKPIARVTAAAERLSEGDVEVSVDVHSRDEVGQLARAFDRTAEYLRDKAGAAERIAAGDLTVGVEPSSERDLLGHAFGKLVTDLRGIVGRVSSSARGVSGASKQMAQTSEEAGRATGEVARTVGEVASGADRQVKMIEAARTTAEEVTRAIQDSAEQAKETAAVAAGARDVAREGVGAAEEANEAMREVRDSSQAVTDAISQLAGKSQQIGAIVETISGIAEQTNLLALNAAIEAARAGEQGRGFAVVAEEVRKLAEESHHAAEEIAELIQAMQSETAKAVEVVERGAERTSGGAATVEQAREAFMRIGSAVDDMTARIEQIATAAQQVVAGAVQMQDHMDEVAAVAEESSASTEQVSATTEQASASTQQIAASAQELATTANELERLVGQFQLES